jgi:ferrous iron transport protein A
MDTHAHSTIPLVLLSKGETARVVHIHGGHGMRKRLFDIGIFPGKNIEIANGWGKGPLVVVVDETRVMIGRGMASRILVEL